MNEKEVEAPVEEIPVEEAEASTECDCDCSHDHEMKQNPKPIQVGDEFVMDNGQIFRVRKITNKDYIMRPVRG